MRPDVDLSVYLVTDTAQCGGVDGVVETVAAAARGGVTLVQLRDHHLSDDDFVSLGRRCVEVLAPFGVPLLVDDRVHLVTAIGAHGAHVGQSDMPPAQARALLGEDAILGLTTDVPDEIRRALRLPITMLDYVGTGALHMTTTKDCIEAIGFSGVADVIALSPWPVCAIGGVTAADAQDLIRIGCDGMSVVSAICGTPDPEKATRSLADAWRAAKESR